MANDVYVVTEPTDEYVTTVRIDRPPNNFFSVPMITRATTAKM